MTHVKPELDEIAQEINGFDLATGKRLPGFAACKDDGTTSCGNWLYSGSYPPEGNLMQRRGTTDPTGLGYPLLMERDGYWSTDGDQSGKAPEDRTWNGRLFGVVPYDFRLPSIEPHLPA